MGKCTEQNITCSQRFQKYLRWKFENIAPQTCLKYTIYSKDTYHICH